MFLCGKKNSNISLGAESFRGGTLFSGSLSGLKHIRPQNFTQLYYYCKTFESIFVYVGVPKFVFKAIELFKCFCQAQTACELATLFFIYSRRGHQLCDFKYCVSLMLIKLYFSI